MLNLKVTYKVNGFEKTAIIKDTTEKTVINIISWRESKSRTVIDILKIEKI